MIQAATGLSTCQTFTIMDDSAGIPQDVLKRKRQEGDSVADMQDRPLKKSPSNRDETSPKQETNSTALIPASNVGVSCFGDHDVLSGRGGGTNVHPGNRTFRDLINLHREAYLKARKNDRPGISRAIVKAIRDKTGRFLKKNKENGLWFEIGDNAAREKTSQALRQRAPEIRKLLLGLKCQEPRVLSVNQATQSGLRTFIYPYPSPHWVFLPY